MVSAFKTETAGAPPNHPPAGSGREIGAVLEEMGEIVGAAQSALLDGRLETLRTSMQRQQELCSELSAILRSPAAAPFREPGVASVAGNLSRNNRVFAAVLRRMRANLEILRNRLRAGSQIYDASIGRQREL